MDGHPAAPAADRTPPTGRLTVITLRERAGVVRSRVARPNEHEATDDHPLTVGGLKLALTSLDDDLPVQIEFYLGSTLQPRATMTPRGVVEK